MTSRRLAAFLDVRAGEGRIVALLAAQSLFIGVSTSLFETLGETLFLTHYGADKLAWVYITWAVVVPLAGLAYAALTERITVTKTWIATAVFVFALTAMTALALQVGGGGISFVMLVARDVFWTLMLMEFWDLAGHLLDLQQAKRLFGLIGGGEVAGGIAAGLLVGPLLATLSVHHVVWIAAGGYLACLGLLLALLRGRRSVSYPNEAPGTTDRAARPEGMRAMLRERYVVLLVMIPVAYTLAYDFLEYGFLSQAEIRHEHDKAALAAFLGTMLAAGQMLTLLTRVLISGHVLMRVGLWVVLAALPAMLCLGAAGILVSSLSVAAAAHLFWPIAGLKLCDSVVRNSLDKPSFLVLFQVLRQDVRMRVHAFQESISEPVASGLSGVILLASTLLLGELPMAAKMAGTAGFIFVFAACWLALIARIRPVYDAMLARALSRRTLAPAEPLAPERSIIAFLQSKLVSSSSGEVIYSLTLLQPLLADGELGRHVEALLDHAEPAVRLAACRCAEDRRVPSLRAALEARLGREAVPDVVGAMLRAHAAIAESDAIDLLAPRLGDPHPAIQMGALVGLLKHGGIPGVLTAGEWLLRRLDSPHAADRIFAADVLGEVAIQGCHQQLLRLLDDPSPNVRRAALAAAAKVPSPRLWPRVLACLSDPAMVPLARQALVAAGREGVPLLEDAFAASTAGPVAETIAQVLGRIGGPAATAGLLARLDDARPEVRREIFRALQGHELGSSAARTAPLLAQLQREVRYAALIHAALADVESCRDAHALARALEEQVDRQLEMVLELLQLAHPRTGLALVRHHLGSDSPAKRAYAIEIIDSTCAREVTRLIRPLVEDLSTAERRARLGPAELLGLIPRLREVIAGAAPWITGWMRVCALYAAGRLRDPALAHDVRAWLDDPHPHVRETALWAAVQLSADVAVIDLRDHITRGLADGDPGVRRVACHLAAASPLLS